MMNIDLSSTIRGLMGEAGNTYDDEQLATAGMVALCEIETYCRRAVEATDECLLFTAARIAAIHLQRVGTEGLASQSFSGVSESFIDGYPADILAILNSKRKIKVVG